MSLALWVARTERDFTHARLPGIATLKLRPGSHSLRKSHTAACFFSVDFVLRQREIGWLLALGYS